MLLIITQVTLHTFITWAPFHLESGLDGGDGGDDGSVRHDGSVHVHFLGGGNGGADGQGVVGAARLLCFHVQQLEGAGTKREPNGTFRQRLDARRNVDYLMYA